MQMFEYLLVLWYRRLANDWTIWVRLLESFLWVAEHSSPTAWRKRVNVKNSQGKQLCICFWTIACSIAEHVLTFLATTPKRFLYNLKADHGVVCTLFMVNVWERTGKQYLNFELRDSLVIVTTNQACVLWSSWKACKGLTSCSKQHCGTKSNRLLRYGTHDSQHTLRHTC
jgi:hypothetical protein